MDKLWDEPRVTVDGDAVGGWIVEVHDGVKCQTYSPDVADADGAKTAALTAFANEFYPAPAEPAPPAPPPANDRQPPIDPA